MASRKREFSELQREKTAEWLLNISQGLLLAVVVGVFVPYLGITISILGVVAGSGLAVVLYLVGMYLIRGVKR